MADIRTSYTVLEDSGTGAGLPLHKVLEGDAAAAKNALPALTAKDGSGNLQYPKVNADRELVVSLEAGDIANLNDTASVAGSATFVDVVVIPLTVSKVYKNLGWICGCLRDSEFKVVHNDNGTPADLALGIMIAKESSSSGQLREFKFTAGGTGTQELKIQAKNFNTLSDFRATLSIDEVA